MQSAQSRRRQPGQRRANPDLVVSYRCPKCSGDHPRAECDAPIVQQLTMRELGRLRARVLMEIGDSYLNGADDEHLQALVKLLRATESKLGRDDDRRGDTLARRVAIAVERRTS